MAKYIQLGDVRIEVARKPIRNLHLSVYPPTGRVRIAAPKRTTDESIRLFAISKIGWIKRQQGKLRVQERESPREYIERESHYVWGRRYLLHVIERQAAPSVGLSHRQLQLQVRPGTDAAGRRAVLDAWYRTGIRAALPALLDKWEPLVERRPAKVYVQRMKTKWGGCNPASRNIRVNTELARKPPELLEYIVLHELVHLREPTHNERFTATMDRLMPRWRDRRDRLNKLPLMAEM